MAQSVPLDSVEAVILAGGLGTRLRNTIGDLPKPLAPVAGRPFLAIVLETLSRQGLKTAVLSVGYRHELVRAQFGDAFAGLSIRYAVERSPLGTGGAIRMSVRQCAGADVFILNGDSHVDVDLSAMLDAHRAARSSLTVCTVDVTDVARYGCVQTDGDRIVGFSARGSPGPGRINAGVYVMARDLLERMEPHAVFSFEQDVLATRLREIRPVAFPARGSFIDIGVPDDYARAQDLFSGQPTR
jgi:D-glycero-alpha-D-manno-heptose 1-phosphate guanylyltransferase